MGRPFTLSKTLFLVKELRADGVDIAFLDPSEQRSFVTQKSASLVLVSLAVALGTGIASSAMWDGLKALVRNLRKADPSPAALESRSSGADREGNTLKVEVTIVDLRQQVPGRRYLIQGSVEEALLAIERPERSDKVEAMDAQPESDAEGRAV